MDGNGLITMKNTIKTKNFVLLMDVTGWLWTVIYFYGVQGVASSNPAVPTKLSIRVTVNAVALFVFGRSAHTMQLLVSSYGLLLDKRLRSQLPLTVWISFSRS